MTVSLRRNNSSGRIPEPMTNFPKPVVRPGGPAYSPDACRIIYIAACAFLPRINVFRRTFLVRGETRRRQVQIYRRTFPERAYPSDPAALITFHEISMNSSCSLPAPARPTRPRGPPVEEIASLTCILRAAILMDTRDSMGTKGCWFNVEGVFVVLMRYNGLDPGC